MADYSEIRERLIEDARLEFDAQIKERFERHVKRTGEDECHEWTGPTNGQGYGTFGLLGKSFWAHRVTLEIHLGRPITSGLFVLHSCDNPSCCNPKHLREGTTADNMADRDARGRTASGARHGRYTRPDRRTYGTRNGRTTHPEKRPKGETNGRALLTEADVIEIRRLRRETRITLAELAERFSVSNPTIQAIVYRRNWAYLE